MIGFGFGFGQGRGSLVPYQVNGNMPVQVLDATQGGLRALRTPLTFARSGTADYLDADLVFRQAAAGVPRVMHDPAGVLPPRMAVEATETRINANPVASVAGWTDVQGATRSDLSLSVLGAFPGLKVVSGGANWNRVGPPSVTVASGGQVTIRTYYMAPSDGSSSGNVRMIAYANAGAFSMAVAGPHGALIAAGATGGTWDRIVNRALPGGLYVCEVTLTNTSGASVTFSFGVGPNSGVAGEAIVALAQFVVAGSVMASDILNPATANTTRAAETAASPMLHGGGPFTVLYDCYLGAVPTSGLPRVFQASIAADVNDNSAQLVYNPNTGKFRVSSVRGAVPTGTDLTVGDVGHVRAALTASDTAVRASVNGSAPAGLTGLTGTVPSVDILSHLANPAGNNGFPGDSGLFQCSVFPGVLSDADLQSWSALP